MPTIAALTLNGTGGADHVFAPYGINGTSAIWYKPGAAPVADEKLTVTLNRVPNSGRIKQMIRLAIPKSEDVDGKTVVTRIGYVNIEFQAESTHTQAERTEMLLLARSMLDATDGAKIVASWVDAEPLY
jgi:hypothetical protein